MKSRNLIKRGGLLYSACDERFGTSTRLSFASKAGPGQFRKGTYLQRQRKAHRKTNARVGEGGERKRERERERGQRERERESEDERHL